MSERGVLPASEAAHRSGPCHLPEGFRAPEGLRDGVAVATGTRDPAALSAAVGAVVDGGAETLRQ